MGTPSEIRKSLQRLRENSIALGMDDLTIAYGWSLMRLGAEILETQMEYMRKLDER